MAVSECNYGQGMGGSSGVYRTLTSAQSYSLVEDIGFIPTKIIVWFMYNPSSPSPSIIEYDVDTGKRYQWYTNKAKEDQGTALNNSIYMDGTTLHYSPYGPNYQSDTYIAAFKE